MAEKIVLPNVNGGYNLSTINDNFQKIENALNEQVLYRDNPEEQSNQMENDLDMNGKRAYNLPIPVLEHEAARFKEVKDAIQVFQTGMGVIQQVGAAAAQSAANALASELSAESAANEAAKILQIIGANAGLKIYASYAEANTAAPTLPQDTLVEVTFDETKQGARTRYRVNAGALVFIANLDGLREDLGVTPEMFGAKGDRGIIDAHINSKAFQNMLDFAYTAGVHVVCSGKQYYLDFPIYVRSGTSVNLNGSELVFVNPNFRKGRGGIVIGSSYEANRVMARTAYDNNTYPGASTNNPSYVNPVLGQYLRDNPSFVEAEYAVVFNGAVTAYWDGTDGNSGGYGINIVNARHCVVHDILGKGWRQLIGMGSDGSPETPSNHNCHAYNLHVDYADNVQTYYSIGFISNSTNCSIRGATQVSPITAGTPNGSGVATNYCEDVLIENIFIPNLGLTATSEGILLNNSKRSVVRNVHIGGCKKVVAVYYTNSAFIASSFTDGNTLTGISGRGTYLIQSQSKYDTFSNFKASDTATIEFFFGNINCTNNQILTEPRSMSWNSTAGAIYNQYWYLSRNTVQGWQLKYAYLRPAQILYSPTTAVSNRTTNGSITATAGSSYNLLWRVPDYMKAISEIRQYYTFGAGSQTAGSNIVTQLRRDPAYNGNIGLVPYIEMTSTVTAASDSVTDGQVITNKTDDFVVMADTTNGLANDLDLFISFNSPTANSYAKRIRVSYWG